MCTVAYATSGVETPVGSFVSGVLLAPCLWSKTS